MRSKAWLAARVTLRLARMLPGLFARAFVLCHMEKTCRTGDGDSVLAFHVRARA